MVTEVQIDNLHAKVSLKHSEIGKALHVIGNIRLVRRTGFPDAIPQNTFKFRAYTQAERDAVYADLITELQRIKADI